MKFKWLDLKAFGQFSKHPIRLSATSGRIDLIYGLNEAGKSTLRRACSDLIFGIPGDTRDAFVHPHNSLRVGGELVDANDRSLIVYRRKGRSGTLLDAADNKVQDDLLVSMLGNTDRGSYVTMFALDHEGLRRGGKDILEGRGEAGQILLQAGTGISNLRQVRAALEEEATGLFKQQGRTQLISTSLARLNELYHRRREAELKAGEWVLRSSELEAIKRQIEQLEERRGALQIRRPTLERVRRNLSLVAEHRRICGELETLHSIAELATGAREVRIQSQSAIAAAECQLLEADSEIKRLRTERDSISLNVKFLRSCAQIRALAEGRGTARKIAQDLPKRRAQTDNLRKRGQELRHQAGIEVDLSEAREMVPAKPLEAALRALIREKEALLSQLETSAGAREEAQRQLQNLSEELQRQIGSPDPTLLDCAIEEICRLGDLDSALSKAEIRAQAARKAAEQGQRSLALWSGSADELIALTIPQVASVERFRKEFVDLNKQLGRLEDQIASGTEKVSDLEGKLFKSEIVPVSEADVSAVREHRNDGWSLIRGTFIDGNPPRAEAAIRFCLGENLPRAYEVAVESADELVDRMRATSRQQADRAALEEELSRLQRMLEKLGSEREQVILRLAELSTKWSGLWGFLNGNPLPPDEMAQWLNDRQRVVEKIATAETAQNELEEVRAQVVRACGRMIGALKHYEHKLGGDEVLPELISKARSLASEIHKSNNLRATLEERIADARHSADSACRLEEQLKRAESDWKSRWIGAVASLGKSDDVSSAEVGALLEIYEELRGLLAELDDICHRVEGMEQDAAVFDESVRRVSRMVGFDFSDVSAIDASVKLDAELASAEKAAGRIAELDALIQRVEMQVKNAERQRSLQTLAVERLCRDAGCALPEDLPAIEEQSARKHHLTERRDEVEHQLTANGDGLSLEELIREVGAREFAELTMEIGKVEEDLKQLDGEVAALAEQLGGVRKELGAMKGGDDAAVIAQEIQLEMSKLDTAARRYVGLRAAQVVLDIAMEEYREKNQDPLLARTGEIFKRITLGSFAGVEVEVDEDGRPVLRGVRSDRTTVAVEGMSSGTLDQLYLALRLAAVERHVSVNPPLPLICDDLLVEFDDDRAMATLEVLGELAHKTQVLFFTHHSKMVELARKALGNERVALSNLVAPAQNAAEPQAA